ncbi:hypothetical protein BJL95_05990 [Methylomonas sp. LWB]|nr:hypothetical protein BJL95_05990 [Methylomonas sp. LWB]
MLAQYIVMPAELFTLRPRKNAQPFQFKELACAVETESISRLAGRVKKGLMVATKMGPPA